MRSARCTARVEETFAENHGRIRGQQTALLALGKLGGREMTATSDLDLIIVYDFDAEHPQSDGARPLYGAQYFARLTQRLISALSSQTNYGALYQVDMRLRPSGRSGPVATSLDAFASYQETEAWTWEHMALTRARVVSGPPAFAARVEEVIRAVLCRKRDPAAVAADVVEMRQAIAKEKGEDARWDLKYAAGGLVDLEFIAQYLQLVHAAEKPEILDTTTARVLDKAWRLGLLSAEDADVLRPAARLYHNLTQILRLCLSGPFDPKTAGAGLLGLLCQRGRPAEFRHARCACRRDAAEGARELQPDFGAARESRRHGGPLLHAFDQRGLAHIGPVRGRIGDGAAELLEILRARRRVLLFHPLLVGDGLLLHELDVERTAVQVVFVENVLGRLAADDAAEQVAQLDRIVDAEVQAEPAERVVDVRGVAREEHAAFAEACRHALMHVVEIAVDDVVGSVLGQEALQPRLGRRGVHQLVVGLLGLRRGQHAPQRAPIRRRSP